MSKPPQMASTRREAIEEVVRAYREGYRPSRWTLGQMGALFVVVSADGDYVDITPEHLDEAAQVDGVDLVEYIEGCFAVEDASCEVED